MKRSHQLHMINQPSAWQVAEPDGAHGLAPASMLPSARPMLRVLLSATSVVFFFLNCIMYLGCAGSAGCQRSLVAVHGGCSLAVAMASPVVGHRPQGLPSSVAVVPRALKHRLGSCGTQLLQGMWDLPG